VADPVEVANVLGVLSAAFPSVTLTEQTAAVWAGALHDVPADALAAAAQKLIVTAKFFPAIAEVREAALSSMGLLPDRAAELAWGEVLDAVSRFGWARAPLFADPLVERALQCTIGWRDLCTSDLSDGSSHRARFIAAYDALQRRVREGLLLPDALRAQIAECRKDYVAGVLEDQHPDRESVSDQAKRARALVAGLGAGPKAAP
jgi:hypothetical protein